MIFCAVCTSPQSPPPHGVDAMTGREREQVVELLRCAADLHITDDVFGGLWSAGAHLELSGSPLWNIAHAARRAAYNEIGGETYLDSCLLAAARVEEGSWP